MRNQRAQQAAAKKMTPPRGKHIAQTMRAQIPHQRSKVAVSHLEPLHIRHGQGETGALKQCAQIANIGERRDAWADAPRYFAFGDRKTLAQFAQCIAAEQRRQKEAIGLEDPADLDQGPGQIVDRLQRIKTDGQVERSFARIQDFLLIKVEDAPVPRKGLDRRRQSFADPQSVVEAAGHSRQPVAQPLQCGLIQETVACDPARARARRLNGAEVENHRAFCGHCVTLKEMGPKLKTALLDLLFPPLCVSCREPLGGGYGFCAGCWSGIAFLDGPMCDCCGLPFAFDPGAGTRCAACLARPPAYDRARAIFAYDENSRAPILALKHADRLDLVPGFAHWLERTGAGLLDGSDLIVPVPLHPIRLWQRRYNQAAELARALGRRASKRVAVRALERTRSTESQGAMVSASGRRRNVRGAFRVPNPRQVADRNILLVDDVLTTGATAEACARALRQAGAVRVQILALARVVKPSEALI